MRALRVVDDDGHAQQRNQREAHRHAVVVISVDVRIGNELFGRRDVDGFGFFHHGRAHFAQFGGHGGDTVGFLHAPRADVAEGAGLPCGQCHHGQGHGGIGNVVRVQIERQDGLVFGAGNFNEIIAPQHGCAQFFQFAGKGNVSLDGVSAQAGNAHGFAGQQTCRQKIAGAGSVAFNVQLGGGVVAAGGGDVERAVLAVFHVHAELFH